MPSMDVKPDMVLGCSRKEAAENLIKSFLSSVNKEQAGGISSVFFFGRELAMVSHVEPDWFSDNYSDLIATIRLLSCHLRTKSERMAFVCTSFDMTDEEYERYKMGEIPESEAKTILLVSVIDADGATTTISRRMQNGVVEEEEYMSNDEFTKSQQPPAFLRQVIEAAYMARFENSNTGRTLH
jgi:hypothetical protein